MGFLMGSGSRHSVVSSPCSLVITTRCFQMKRSLRACLAVGMTPLTTGPAGSPADGCLTIVKMLIPVLRGEGSKEVMMVGEN